MSEPQDLKNRALKELEEAKKDILDKVKNKLKGLFDILPQDVKSLPLICLTEALKRNYDGKLAMVKKNKNILKTSNRLSLMPKEYPSIILQIENQSFVFDGNRLKTVGVDNGEYNGIIDEISTILKKYIKQSMV